MNGYNLSQVVPKMAAPQRLFLACYGASGAAALVYQVVWVRLLTLTFGHTVASSSIVLAAFMCGLALGAWIAGQVKLAPQRALRVYAALELLIAVAAIALPAALSQFRPLVAWAYADGTVPTRFTLVRTAICFGLLGVPAAAMGATFPVAVAWFVGGARPDHPDTPAQTSTDAGRLYATNTAGAALGALAAGFWLIPVYGARASTWIAVGLNGLAAAGALWIATDRPPSIVPRRSLARRNAEREGGSTHRRSSIVDRPSTIVAVSAAALSGVAALVFEVAWTRLIALIIGPTTYAFALMAASFIVGIAIGSTLGVRIARGSTHRGVWLCAMLTLSAAGTLVAAWFTALEVPLVVARSASEIREFGPLLLRETLVVGLLLTAASIAFGATFTLALATASPDIDTAARDSSIVYTANTIGAVVGSLTAGFVLLPRFGLASTFIYTCRILMAAGAGFAAIIMYRRTAPRRSAALTAIGAACLFAGTFALPSWNHALLSSGFYKYARHIDPQDLEITLRAGRLEYYKEGPAGTVSVKLLGGTRSLAIDGKVDASDGADMLTQRLLGLLPTVLHPNPQDALVIGLGSGVTAHAVRAAGAIRRLDIVEISPQVVEASALFERQNGGVLNAPGVRLLIGDGRSHLQLTPKLYDVIVSEPSNPWMAGVAALFTREFFEAVRRRLSEDGVFCQWAHTYEIDIGDLRSIVRTFVSVFPHGTLWLVGDGDLLLIGTHGPQLERQMASIGERLQKTAAARLLSDSGVASSSGPFFLLSLYAGGPRELAGFGESAPMQTDDRLKLEFTAARAMYAPPEGNAPALRKLAAGAAPPAAVSATLRAATAADWIARGEAGLKAEAFQMAHESFRRAATLDSRNYEAPRGAVTAAAGAGRVPEETRWLRDRADTAPQNAAVRTALSYVLAMTGDMDGAISAAVEATTIDSDSPQPLEQLASVLADAGDPRLASVAATLIRKFPARDDSRFYRAAALFFQNRHDEAEGAVTALVDANPRHARAHNLRGIIRAAKGDHEGAIAAFRASLDADPRDMTVYVNLGNAYLERGDVDMASRVFSEAVALDPRSDAARDALQRIAR